MAHTCAQSSWKLISKHMETDEESDISIVQAATLLAIFDFTGIPKPINERLNKNTNVASQPVKIVAHGERLAQQRGLRKI